jgi:hypothetical protein
MAKKIKKLLTLEQLVQFCEQNKFHNFSSKDTGYTLSVQVPGNLKFSNEEDEDLLYTTVKVCHTMLNRNGSYISEKNMKKNMHTLKYKPLLASIVEDEDGELDFNGHDMEFNDDGTINYIEKQIGTFTIDEPYLEYDKEQDKTYVMATAVIPREYTAAASIIERKNGTKVSCELRINEMQYNAKEKYLELTDFVFSGVCCLGESVGEGMLGSRLDITDFSTENNSLHYEENDKLVEVLEKLNTTLSNFQIDNKNRKEEQFVESNKNIEEVVEEVIETTDEAVVETTEEVVEETFEDATEESTEEVVTEETSEETTEESTEETPDVVVEEETTETEETVEEVYESNINYSVNGKNFAVSLDDIQYALNTLVNDTYAEQDGCYYATTIYEDHLVMIDYWTGKAYRQSYKKRKDVYSLTGDRVAVKSCWLTADEEKAIDDMRSNFAEVSEKLAKYEAEPAKMEVINSESYAKIAETKEFAELRDNHFDLSVEEVSAKADEILLAYAKGGSLNFSAEPEKKYVGMTRLPIQTSSNKKSRYGSLFSK